VEAIVGDSERTMNYQTLDIETRNQVAHVWMNRPEMHNAFDETLIAELTNAFEKLDADAAVRVVVLGGRGKSFSAGADLNWMKRAASYTVDENLRDARALAKMLKTINLLSKPTVARVQGAALGGGTGLTTACDIAIASTQASFATTEVKFGIIPGAISPYVIAAIGSRAARRYFLTAERFDAQEAQRIGMVHEVCAPEALDDRVNQIVSSLLVAGPKAQAAAKDLIRAVVYRPVDDAVIADTSARIANIRAAPEAREGIGAFLAKRKPSWVTE
jgi:methylglutaconyl-CoA hydratase